MLLNFEQLVDVRDTSDVVLFLLSGQIRSGEGQSELGQQTAVITAGPGDAEPPGENVQLCLQEPHLVRQLSPGGRDQARVDTGVETSARVDTERVAFLGGGASQDRHQAE